MYKKFYFFILITFFTPKIEAQFHEIGIFLGGSNYIGDIGSHRYLDPNELAYGFLYRWNITDRYSLRGGITLTTLNENEFKNNDINRFKRSYKINNSIEEIVAGFEINFKEFNLHDPVMSFTPYIFYGIGYFRYDQFFIEPGNSSLLIEPEYNNYGKDRKIAIPISVGFKFNPNPFFVLGFEVGARYALTDNLDGSNPENQYANNLNYKFGNLNNNDWYIFTGFTISFTFGDLPCYCKE